MKRFFALCCVTVWMSTLYASTVEMGIGGVKFDYSEYLDDGSWYNSEKSDSYEIDGGFIKYGFDLGFLEDQDIKYNQALELYYSFHLNQAEHTQVGAKTNTDNYLHQGHLRYKATNKIENYELGLFLGLGYRYWDRDILNNSELNALLETYEWPYYEAGLSWRWYDGNFHIGIDGSYQKAYKPKMHAATYGGLDFDLGDTSGYKIDIPVGYKVNGNWDLSIHYIYDRWEIEKSNVVTTTTVTAWEPKSTTENSYVYLSVAYTF